MTISLLEWKDGKTFHYEHRSFLVKHTQTITTITAVEGRETISLLTLQLPDQHGIKIRTDSELQFQGRRRVSPPDPSLLLK